MMLRNWNGGYKFPQFRYITRLLCFILVFLTCFIIYLRLSSIESGGKVLLAKSADNAKIPQRVYTRNDTTVPSQAEMVKRSLIDTLKTNGYEYDKTESSDARRNQWYSEKNKNVTVTGHHFFVKSYHVHHVLVFYNRSEFLWSSDVGSLPSIVKGVLKFEDISIGREASGFEKFVTRTVQVGKNTTIQVPSNMKQFLFEVPTSRFVECNHEVARKFYAKHGKERKLNDSFDRLTVDAISALKELTKPFMMPFWICSGTLLGWYRQCGVIPYTTDVDLAAWSSDISESFEAEAEKNRTKLVLKYVYGIPSQSYQYAFYYSNIRIDFFFTYKEENVYYYGGHIPETQTYFHYIYPKFMLCSADLLGSKVLVPCNSKQVISAEYGEGWMVPIKRWSYFSSAYNMGPRITWPSDIVEKTYRKY